MLEFSVGRFFRNPSAVISVFQSLVNALPSESSRKSYGKFLSLFEDFLCNAPISLNDLTPEMTNRFAEWLIDKGYSQTYITRIGQNFKSLYNAAAKRGHCSKRNDLFNWVSSKKGKAKQAGCRDLTGVVLALNSRNFTPGSIHYRYRAYINLSLLLGGAPLYITAGLTRECISDGRVLIKGLNGDTRSFPCTEMISKLISEIRTKDTNPDKTPEAASRIISMADGLLLPPGEAECSFNDDSLSETTEAILKAAGFKGSEIKEYLYKTSGSSSLALLGDTAAEQMDIDKATYAVEKFLFDSRKRWYALRMFTPYDDVVSLIKESGGPSGIDQQSVYLYYPMGEIFRKVNGKIRKMKAPVLKNILFVSAEKRSALALSRLLSGKASFFRTSHNGAECYSVIPDKEMARFQELMSADGEFIPVDDGVEFPAGSRLDVTGDIFTGRKAIVIRKEKDGRYLVSVLGSNFRVITTKISQTFLR